MDNSLEAQIILLNCQAMNCLDKPKRSLKLLQSAEKVLLSEEQVVVDLPNRLQLLAVTFNNLACYYKSVKQPNVALFYLKQALALEMQTFAEPAAIASTNLNLCAIYSQLNKHKYAMKSALSAIKYLKGYENEDEVSENIINSVVVANYNIGVEFEHLNKHSKALEFYTKGRKIALEYLGPDHPMSSTLTESLKSLNQHQDSLNSFIVSRRNLRNHGKLSSQSMDSRAEISPKFRIYQSPHTKFPKIIEKQGKKKLISHRLSLEPLPRDLENRSSLLESGTFGTRKFSNAIERLKLLIN